MCESLVVFCVIYKSITYDKFAIEKLYKRSYRLCDGIREKDSPPIMLTFFDMERMGNTV